MSTTTARETECDGGTATAGDRAETLSPDERDIFERIKDRYGTDDEVGRIAELVIQSSASPSSEEARS
jgi:hypothetical protein